MNRKMLPNLYKCSVVFITLLCFCTTTFSQDCCDFFKTAFFSDLVGSRCLITHKNEAGVCAPPSDCPIAEFWVRNGIRPDLCGYEFFGVPIICCEIYFSAPSPSPPVQEYRANSFTSPYSNNPFLNNLNRGQDIESNNQNSNSFVYPEAVDQHYSGQSLSKSEEKCKEYSKLISNTISAIPLLVDPEQINVSVPKCEYNGIPLIVGGSPALPGEFPFMAAVGGYNSEDQLEWFCGGTLVSERYVLTAAHCVRSSRGAPTLVRLGDLDLKRDNDGSQPKTYVIREIIVHENYKPPVKYNDIALLKLKAEVEFSKYIRPACLWNKLSLGQSRVIATGWGKTGASEEQSDVLLKVGLNVFDNAECNRVYTRKTQTFPNILPRGITNKMMCVGELEGGKDTCTGDSGGPLVINDRSNQCLFYVVGITSFGKSYCGAQNSPAVYTTVSQFVPWIEKHIW